MAEKLFLVTRADLTPGQQAVQACHAMREFGFEHPEEDRRWHSTSNTLALLAVPNEEKLLHLVHKARCKGLRLALFREPDRGNELTAVALEPKARTLLRGLGLALSSP